MKVYIDPKADEALVPALQAMMARGEAFQAECMRRRVKFLPKQVMRPVYAQAGLSDGAILKAQPDAFYDLSGTL